jgi:hypothetical protein
MNVTLSVDEKVLARAREHAHERGTSVDRLTRVEQLERLWSGPEGRSGGWKWNRER